MAALVPAIVPRMTYSKKQTCCKSKNIPIGWFTGDDGAKKTVYYIDSCMCSDKGDIFREISSPQGNTINPIPFFIKNQRIGPICISAMSGGGKSHYCNRLAREITELNKRNSDLKLEHIYLVTAAIAADPAYDTENLGPIRLDLEHAMKNATIEDFAHSLVIFDDHTNQPDPEIESWVKLLGNQLLERSRKLQAHLIFCNHRQRAGAATTLLNIESQAFVLFYNSNRNESAKLLKDYLDFSRKDINRLYSHDYGRYSAAYVNRSPRYIILNEKIYQY